MTLPPVLDAAGRPLDTITLARLTARGRHGVYAEERRDGQDFGVDAVLHVDLRAAGASDDLTDTVDYGVLANRLGDIVRGEPVDLIERLAHLLAVACLDDPRVQAVDVAVHKPQAPVTEAVHDVVVALRRTRADVAVAAGADVA